MPICLAFDRLEARWTRRGAGGRLRATALARARGPVHPRRPGRGARPRRRQIHNVMTDAFPLTSRPTGQVQ